MPSGREELRRGVRHLIETASRELEALAAPPAPPVLEERSAPAGAARRGPGEAPTGDARPILRLVREPAPEAPTPRMKATTGFFFARERTARYR